MKDRHFSAAISLLAAFLFTTSCVNQLYNEDEEYEIGTTPISFTAQIKQAQTRMTDNEFEVGDKIGLYTLINGKTLKDSRYIDNMALTYGSNGTLTPSQTIFYPEGNGISVDFLAYYPYQGTGVEKGKSELPISVAADQSQAAYFMNSDFLVAEKKNVGSSNNNVELEFKHKLSKLKFTLETSSEDVNVANMLADNPRITVTGCYTNATYDWEQGTTTADNTSAADMVAGGEWSVTEKGLTGKELIVIPQVFDKTQTIAIEWCGRIYHCEMPTLNTNATGDETDNATATATEAGKQYEIKISVEQVNSYVFTGVRGSISDWEEGESKETENTKNYSAIYYSSLTFDASNIYRVHSEGMPIAEICKEYIRVSDSEAFEAIVSYPIVDNEADLTKGTIINCPTDVAKNGGTVAWPTEGEDKQYTYTAPTTTAATPYQLYYDANGQVYLDSYKEDAVTPAEVMVVAYTIRDTRVADLQEYGIVKIGNQYWMRENLATTYYQDGTALSQQTQVASGNPGYYLHTNGYTAYFYNGEALNAGELSPEDWRIPTEDDWKTLTDYINGEVSHLKAGTWVATTQGKDVAAVDNLTGFSAYAVGIWSVDGFKGKASMTGFWTWDSEMNCVAEKTLHLGGEYDKFVSDSSKPTDSSVYKALSIRCIKE